MSDANCWARRLNTAMIAGEAKLVSSMMMTPQALNSLAIARSSSASRLESFSVMLHFASECTVRAPPVV